MAVPPESAYPPPFADAVASLERARLRPEVVITQIPAPQGLAPYALALSGDLAQTRFTGDTELGVGRFVLLHDPESPDAWSGQFRVVCYAQAPLDLDIAADSMITDVAWSWILDALDSRNAAYTAASGTITTELSTGYGELARTGTKARVEVRASWTPQTSDAAPHVEAWGELLGMLAGLPPIAEGSVPLHTRRHHD